MEEKIIIANWKSYLSLAESEDLAKEISDFIKSKKGLPELVICPSYPALPGVNKIIEKNKFIELGAQSMSYVEKGAYTGEVSPIMLKEVGCKFVILGHSERRQHFGEKNLDVHERLRLALVQGLTPVVCVGETAEERQAGKQDDVVREQVSESIGTVDLNENDRVIIAYEPIWAIGTGMAVEPDQAVHLHQVIRQTMIDSFSELEFNKHFQIIYGGSVDSENIEGFLERDIITGVLVGSASTKEEKFTGIINAYINR
jgi:triosephosphate isomerase